MIWKNTRLCSLLGIEHPIIQAPMAGASSPEMAIAAANAGALGSLGAAFTSPETLLDEARIVHAGTNRATNFNFFAHTPPKPDAAKSATAMEELAPWYEKLNAGAAVQPAETQGPFDTEMCDTLLAISARVVSFHFGLPAAEHITRLKDNGTLILSTATSAAEAIWLQENGADAIIAQGYEAGGHNGWFLPRNGADLTGTFALIPRVADAVTVPVIAAGGIADGRGIAAALMLGADGVQIGTAFLATPECRTAEVHKQAILKASGDDTLHSKAFSGRAARSIANDYARDMAQHTDWPDFPLMNSATAPLRKASANAGHGDAFALWAGQAVGFTRAETTGQVIERLVQETESAISQF